MYRLKVAKTIVCFAHRDSLYRTATMAESTLHGHAAQYAPYPVKDVKDGDTKYWCRCGLSKKQPWCDGSHKGTGITPLKWTAEGGKETYYMCGCKQTNNPPFCDGKHKTAKDEVDLRQTNCSRKAEHQGDCKLCTGCGWTQDF